MAETENIYQKLSKIRKRVEVMQKDTKAYSYNYVAEEDLLAKISTMMERLHLSLIPSILPNSTKVSPNNFAKTKMTKDGQIYEENVHEVLVSADMTWTWINNDNPEERVTVPWITVGQQSDAAQALGSGLTYPLDDRHMLAELEDNSGIKSWWLFTFKNPVKDGVIDCEGHSSDNPMWDMKEIDPNNFEWNGQRVYIKKEE